MCLFIRDIGGNLVEGVHCTVLHNMTALYCSSGSSWICIFIESPEKREVYENKRQPRVCCRTVAYEYTSAFVSRDISRYYRYHWLLETMTSSVWFMVGGVWLPRPGTLFAVRLPDSSVKYVQRISSAAAATAAADSRNCWARIDIAVDLGVPSARIELYASVR